jgi:hypothetical protein
MTLDEMNAKHYRQIIQEIEYKISQTSDSKILESLGKDLMKNQINAESFEEIKKGEKQNV